MKCSKCNTENLMCANYCKKCGNKFNDKEKEINYNKTIYGEIDQGEKWYKRFTLQNITGSLAFQIISSVIILAVGMYYLFTIGINTRVLTSEQYEIYNTGTKDEYYLVTDSNTDKISLNLYIPNRTVDIGLKHFKHSGEMIDEANYKSGDEIVLNVLEDDYYLLKTTYSDKSSDEKKLFLYPKDVIRIDE